MDTLLLANVHRNHLVMDRCQPLLSPYRGCGPQQALSAVNVNSVVIFFEAMKQKDVVPNVITFCALIGACAAGKQPKCALEVFRGMQQ